MTAVRTLPDYSVTGAGDLTVFLLHGAFGAKEYWRTQIGALSGAGYRVVAWDCPGYGFSPLPDDFGVETCARACAELIDHEGGAVNVLLGHSMGGMIAQRAFDYRTDRVAGLVLSATSAAFGRADGDWQQSFVHDRVAPLDAGQTLAEYAPRMLRGMMGQGANSPETRLVIEVVSQMREETFRAAIAAITRFDGRDILPKMAKVPVICIAGEHDLSAAPSAVMEKLAGKIGGEFVCLPDVGHFAWAENPPAFNDVMLDFLGRHFASAA